MNLRRANIRDTERIVKLVKSGLKEFGFVYSSETSESDLLNIEREYFGNNGIFLVLENNNKLIATGAIKEIKKNIFKIRKMYVDKSQRGKGFGKQILIHLIEFATSKGAKNIVLETSILMTNAVQLYTIFGFQISKQKPSSPRCDLTLVKRLDYSAIKLITVCGSLLLKFGHK